MLVSRRLQFPSQITVNPDTLDQSKSDAEYTNLNKPFNIESVQIDDAAYAIPTDT